MTICLKAWPSLVFHKHQGLASAATAVTPCLPQAVALHPVTKASIFVKQPVEHASDTNSAPSLPGYKSILTQRNFFSPPLQVPDYSFPCLIHQRTPSQLAHIPPASTQGLSLSNSSSERTRLSTWSFVDCLTSPRRFASVGTWLRLRCLQSPPVSSIFHDTVNKHPRLGHEWSIFILVPGYSELDGEV